MRRRSLLSVVLFCVLGTFVTWLPCAGGSPSFVPLGVLPDGPQYSRAHNISGDGSTVVGESGSPTNGYGSPTTRLAFRWTESGGMEFVGPASENSSRAYGVSRDGAVVVGASFGQAFRWQGGTASYLGGSNLPGWSSDSAADVSDDGSITVGSLAISYENHGVKWNGGMTVYPDPSQVGGFAGITVVGGQEILAGAYKRVVGYEPALFRNGIPQPLGSLGPSAVNGWYFGVALDVSRNGRAAVGYSTSPRAGVDWYEAFRWTESQGMVGLGDLPGGDYASKAWATSANGGVVVGNSHTRYTTNYRGTNDAFYWTPQGGMQKLSTVLTQGFGIDLSGWSRLDDATGVDDSGLVIAGWGTRTNGSEEAFRVKLQQQIYINWNDQIRTGFQVMKNDTTGKYYSVTVPGTYPSLFVPPTLPDGSTADEFRDTVVDYVRSIFQNSGIDIDILDSRTSAPRSAALEVRFGPLLAYPDGRSSLIGKAWDVGPAGLPGVDRFNARWDGEVAILANPNELGMGPWFSAEGLGETIAHEVGHGLGLRHVNPDGAGAMEIMDYDHVDYDFEIFTDVVSPIIEPPTANGTLQGLNHNPAYHLKRYVLGQMDGGGSLPGGWDLGEITIRGFHLENLSISREIYNLTPVLDEGSDAFGEGLSNVGFFDVVDPATFNGLDFLTYGDRPLRILASSLAGTTWDLYFGTGDASDPDLVFDDLTADTLNGSIFQYDPLTGQYEIVGSFSASLTDEMTLPGTVPEPHALALLVFGAVCLRLRRNRHGI